ncbi:Flp pilus assembly protein CpaB [Novosphingobium soli]|uniref:Flp pilus assembly protein CpaB n=1 Tax=Novosphingobium soli TaxID=574956 RepID=UPI003636F052
MRLGSKAKLTIGAGLTAAAVFGFLGVRELGRSASMESNPAARLVARSSAPAGVVLAATTRAVRVGETIRADMIRNAALDPARFPAAATPVEAIGRVAIRDIPANTLISRTALEQETKLAIRIPVGMRAISIDTTAEIAVAGLVRPGDRVDVQVVYPGEDAISGARGTGRSRARTMLQMVPVLAVGELVIGTPAKDAATGTVSTPPPARNMTLALTPGQVSELSLAKSTGSLYLSLRNPEDKAQVEVPQLASAPEAVAMPRVSGLSPAARVTPLATPLVTPLVTPRTAAPAPASLRPRPAPHAIELVVGGNREVIYSGSAAQ